MAYTLSTRKAVRHLLAYWDAASADQIVRGASWYMIARDNARDMADASGLPVDVCAAVISHLSPQTRWEDNLSFAWHVVEERTRPVGCMQSNYERAMRAITAHYAGTDVLATFGPRAHKTRRFASAIIDGGTGAHVVVDVHMLRVILQGPDYVYRDGQGDDLAKVIKRVGVYEQAEHAVRLAAKRRGVPPCVMQATTWLVVTENRGI